jgi:predicted DNA-binding protein (UPF0251 family)
MKKPKKRYPVDYSLDKVIAPHFFKLYEMVLELVAKEGITQAKAFRRLGMSQSSFYRVKRFLRDGVNRW